MPTLQSLPRSGTWECLQNSRNEAAIATLSTGLASQNGPLRLSCLKTLSRRSEPQARLAILSNWEHFGAEDREYLRTISQRFVEVAERLLRTGTVTEKQIALDVILDLELADAIEPVLHCVLDSQHALQEQAVKTLHQLCEHWGLLARTGKIVPGRTHVLDRLYAHLINYAEHKNGDLVGAWLRLAHWDDAYHRGFVSDPWHDAYQCMLLQLRESRHPSILQLLAGYVHRHSTPAGVLKILMERTEPELAYQIAQLIDDRTLGPTLRRLRELPQFPCFLGGTVCELEASQLVERRRYLLLAATSDELEPVLKAALELSKIGSSSGRTTAAEMLSHCKQHSLEDLVAKIQVAGLKHWPEPQIDELLVEAAAWVHSPSQPLKGAAVEFFVDFTLKRLLQEARRWPTQMSKAMASVVKVIERDVEETLCEELQSPAPKRRLAALQVTQILGAIEVVSHELLPLLHDPRLEVRVRMIDVLSALGFEELETLLPKLLDDASTDIQDAARRAERRLTRSKPRPPQSAAGISS
ncbi:HEAT repeat domain-containing protein [Aureliella helgolandensis]|uniref:HEAT repeat protein n=1 Tax=Aureliella helgolandensis TaxID=2527968 RepID=A0A518FZL0_9BACT|nr:hypothetical protein [Aureliella helgolandensis]QDV21756.1 hypothetical protein Q31a_00350 [Aureliella helgolandensis]